MDMISVEQCGLMMGVSLADDVIIAAFTVAIIAISFLVGMTYEKAKGGKES